MRTTVDLPPAVRRRAEELAAERGQSLSAVVAELVTRGLAQIGEPVVLETNPETGFPLFRLGRPVTVEEVEEALDEP